jgi:hypothetical protein
MSQPERPLRVRVDFEPNRFAGEQLIAAYERLKSTESRRAAPEVAAAPAAATRARVAGSTR